MNEKVDEFKMFVDRKQLQEILKKANQHARKQAKESGASIYYIKNNRRIREDAEGNKFEIIFNSTGERQEFEYHE